VQGKLSGTIIVSEDCAGLIGKLLLGNGARFQHSQKIHSGLPSRCRWFVIYRAGHSLRVVASGLCWASVLASREVHPTTVSSGCSDNWISIVNVRLKATG